MRHDELYRLAIVDDDRLVASLIASYFKETPQLKVVMMAENGIDFMDQMEGNAMAIDLLILDLRMKEMDGIATMEVVRKQFPEIKIIVLSSYYSSSAISFMLKSGANAFQPKGILPEELLSIVMEVAVNGYYFSAEQMESIRRQIPATQGSVEISPTATLTQREVEILELICHQKTGKEIADMLFIAPRTVEGHRNNLLMKTGTKNIAGLVIFAIQNKLIDPDSLPSLS